MSGLVLTVRPGSPSVMEAAERLRQLRDTGRSVAFALDHDASGVGDDEPPTPSLILLTSGSSGDARGVELDLPALDASATLAEERLGGPGIWLTAIPVTGAGGMNTVWRSVRNGFDPVVWPGIAGAAHFDGGSFLPFVRSVRDRARAEGVRAYTSLVPTQVARLLSFARANDSDSVETLRALADLDAVLIGADALRDELRAALSGYGIPFVTTYGSTETTGGCVFDDRPLDGTSVSVDGEDPGRIVISGPTVAARYRDGGEGLADRTWRSHDIGRWHLGRLEIVGRLDDIVKVGGAALALPHITQTLRTLAELDDVLVLARPDAEWGHVPVAFVAGCRTSDDVLRQFASAAAARGSIPMDIVRLDTLPLLPNGKHDRQRLLAMVQ